MTQRCRWLALIAVAGLFLGLLRSQAGLSLLSMSVLVWLLTEWTIFTWRCRREVGRLRFHRSVNGRSDASGYLWAGREATIDVHVTSAGGSIGSLLLIRDVIPENLLVLEKSAPQQAGNGAQKSSSSAIPTKTTAVGSPNDTIPSNEILVTSACEELQFSYCVAPRSAGRLRMPGFRLVLQDANGFFRFDRFVPAPQGFRVLPACATHADLRPLVKRINALPQHGIHSMQRSGMGSELLELREYVDGDPPKSIAWKVSARRDKLMTRQYESEVPVRVQLFVDGSIGTRIGGFGARLLDQMTWIAASISRAAVSVGDPVGAMLFDERGPIRVAPQSGEKGYYRILEALADFSENPQPVAEGLSPQLLKAAAAVCGERFPELFDVRFNQIPWTVFPILPFARRRFHQRLQLAGVMAQIYDLPLDEQIALVCDDLKMATFLQTFLSQSGLAWMEPVTAVRGRGFNDTMTRMDLLSNAIARAVSHARDNEVFVVMADLLECAAGISRLTPAVKMALARHHRVAFVCPSPTFQRPGAQTLVPRSTSALDLMIAARQIQTREQTALLQKSLRRLGAGVSVSGEHTAVQFVLSEMNLARTGRLSTAGGMR